MDFDHIKNYLEKFKVILSNNDDVLKNISLSVFNSTNKNIEIKNISIKNNIIYIKTSPLVKGEVFMKKELILKDLNLKTNKDFLDIK